MCQPVLKPIKAAPHPARNAVSKLLSQRSTLFDIICFLIPALFCTVTNVLPIYLTGILRIVSTHLTLTAHYTFVDKDNYYSKLSQKQLLREKGEYLVGIVLHMWAQVVLQLLFPGMFFNPTNIDTLYNCAKNTFLAHVLVVEPLYYVVHRWLHVPDNMKSMHGFHHSSVNTCPSTSLVQDFQEHFIYIATFGPAMLLPFFVAGQNHWIVVMAYLILFDLVNAVGHTNIVCQHWLFISKFSPLRYLLYTPEFHLGHHHYFNVNFGLFMPVWDHVFGTYREYKKPNLGLMHSQKQNFVFIGHNGGLGHFLTIPEISIYNVYDAYLKTSLPIEAEFFLMNILATIMRCFSSCYRVSRYLIDGQHIGRVICLLRTPMDYIQKSKFSSVNKEIVDVIRREYESSGTRCFGLGNLNKMKQLNDGGALISDMVKNDAFLKDKDIRVWTGDTMTTASIFHQLIAIPDLQELFYIGANGKIGNALCKLLVERNIKICVFSKYEGFSHPNVRYTDDMRLMTDFKYTLIGKIMRPSAYSSVFKKYERSDSRFLLDYTVPFMPISVNEKVKHIQIGVLNSTNSKFLQGPFDFCFGLAESQIYPCHAGCIVNYMEKRESDETGEIDVTEIVPLWGQALKYGLRNTDIDLLS